MWTSYYAISGKLPTAVSIAARAPAGYLGREYKKLAPKYHFFAEYKKTGDTEKYTRCYHEEVLAKLDPLEVFAELGKDAVLLCYEKSGDFCHRRLVAEWLEKNLEIKVPELDKGK